MITDVVINVDVGNAPISLRPIIVLWGLVWAKREAGSWWRAVEFDGEVIELELNVGVWVDVSTCGGL